MSRIRRFAGAAVLALAAGLVAAPAAAQCTVTPATLTFGDYDERDLADHDVQADIGVTCDAGVNYQILLGAGTHSGGSFDPRRMAGGPYFLNYNLYVNSGRTLVWNDGTDAAHYVSGSGNGSEKLHTVYGRIFALQAVGVGGYSDAVAVSVMY